VAFGYSLCARRFLGRSRLLVFLTTLAFLALLLRAAWIAGPANSFYQRQGDLRVERHVILAAKRGELRDRHGTILAEQLPAGAIYAEPASMNISQLDQYTKVAQLLHLPAKNINEIAQTHRRFTYLARQLEPEVIQQVLALELPGLHAIEETRRVYPQGEPFTALLGHVDPDGTGNAGLELALQQRLAPVTGSRIVQRDRMGHVIGITGATNYAQQGQTITLSIDARLQSFSYASLARHASVAGARSAVALIADVHTGEVLAAASWNSLHRAPEAADNARALTEAFEPGSIIKPLIVAAALELGRVTPDTTFHTHGPYSVGHARITDVRDFGDLDVASIIEKSSNIGMAKIASRLSAAEMRQALEAFGFGRRASAVSFPGLATGNLKPVQMIDEITQATMAYGYGLTASPVQLAQAFAALGNAGIAPPLTLERVNSPTVAGTRLFSPTTAQAVLAMLERVTQSGSGRDARITSYRVGGKTGTAYLHIPGRGYDKHRYRASFIGLAPLSSPDIVVVVSVEDPTAGSHFGGKLAAPICAEIMAQALQLRHVPPDNLSPNQGRP
jgi:cell division protein FtsI (penicillin-binding protein 3)